VQKWSFYLLFGPLRSCTVLSDPLARTGRVFGVDRATRSAGKGREGAIRPPCQQEREEREPSGHPVSGREKRGSHPATRSAGERREGAIRPPGQREREERGPSGHPVSGREKRGGHPATRSAGERREGAIRPPCQRDNGCPEVSTERALAPLRHWFIGSFERALIPLRHWLL
jgi:hypothetical protein